MISSKYRRLQGQCAVPANDNAPAARLVWRSALSSAEADRLEIRIGLDDLAQPIFGRAIAAVGVRMVAFDQRLELPLDLLRRGIRLEAERVERLALGIAHG